MKAFRLCCKVLMPAQPGHQASLQGSPDAPSLARQGLEPSCPSGAAHTDCKNRLASLCKQSPESAPAFQALTLGTQATHPSTSSVGVHQHSEASPSSFPSAWPDRTEVTSLWAWAAGHAFCLLAYLAGSYLAAK